VNKRGTRVSLSLTQDMKVRSVEERSGKGKRRKNDEEPPGVNQEGAEEGSAGGEIFSRKKGGGIDFEGRGSLQGEGLAKERRTDDIKEVVRGGGSKEEWRSGGGRGEKTIQQLITYGTFFSSQPCELRWGSLGGSGGPKIRGLFLIIQELFIKEDTGEKWNGQEIYKK